MRARPSLPGSRSLAGFGLALVLAAGAAPAAAQQPDSSALVDYIVAVVGNRVILRSQVEEQVLTALRGQEPPSDPGQLRALRRTILEGMIDRELVVQEAQRDTAIKVTDEEVTQAVDEQFRNVRRQFQTDEAFRKELQDAGFQTIEEWRSYTAELQRQEFYWNRFWERLEGQGKVKAIPPTDDEVREYFDRNRLTFPKRSEAVSFQQIVIAPQASAAERARALALADSILREIRGGADFATAARRFSMDPASREQGGSLGWIRRGQGFDQRFEDEAFRLRVGQVSDPVESPFGYHLIQVERAQPAELSVRHILIMADVDSAQADSARLRAEAVYRAAQGGASFDSLQRLHHDRSEEREAEQFPLDRLTQSAPSYATALRDVPGGSLAPLFRLEAPQPNRAKHVVLKVTNRIPAGEVRFEDVRDQIRSTLSRTLARQRHLARLKEATFVEIRPT
jgi:peptidyl-prolyl cis-trans isomerase SurA